MCGASSCTNRLPILLESLAFPFDPASIFKLYYRVVVKYHIQVPFIVSVVPPLHAQPSQNPPSMALPTLVFIPGAWHSPVIFDRLISILNSHGYKCLAIRLPSWDPNPENCNTTHEPDIAAIRTAIVSELDAGKSSSSMFLVLKRHAPFILQNPKTAVFPRLFKSPTFFPLLSPPFY